VITDVAGCPRELIDSLGQVVISLHCDAWGTIGSIRDLSEGKVCCPIRFQGQWFDEESGLHFNRFRYYDPIAARFISPDPARLIAGLNLYAYAPNPLGWIDPLGLVNINQGNEVGLRVHAYPSPPAGGDEHLPLHAHLYEGKPNDPTAPQTRVLMEDYYKEGKLVVSKGEVYPGDPPMTKSMKKAIKKNLDKYAEETNCVFNTGEK
jgi:RHS repeat-associated protein